MRLSKRAESEKYAMKKSRSSSYKFFNKYVVKIASILGFGEKFRSLNGWRKAFIIWIYFLNLSMSYSFFFELDANSFNRGLAVYLMMLTVLAHRAIINRDIKNLGDLATLTGITTANVVHSLCLLSIRRVTIKESEERKLVEPSTRRVVDKTLTKYIRIESKR